jgi:cell division protein FtsB
MMGDRESYLKKKLDSARDEQARLQGKITDLTNKLLKLRADMIAQAKHDQDQIALLKKEFARVDAAFNRSDAEVTRLSSKLDNAVFEVARLRLDLSRSIDMSGFGKTTAERVEHLLRDMGANQPMVLIALENKRGVAIRLHEGIGDDWFRDEIIVFWSNGDVTKMYDVQCRSNIQKDTELRFYGMLTRD